MKNIFIAILCISLLFNIAGLPLFPVTISAEEDIVGGEKVQDISIPYENQAIYTCKINYVEGDTVTVSLGDTPILSLSEGTLRMLGAKVYGTYSEGQYSLVCKINPEQRMLFAELKLPDGGTLRRGIGEFNTHNCIVASYGASAVSDISVTYEDVAKNEYPLPYSEPQSSGFSKKVYNIITSFDDAKTTRNFAWTAASSFGGENSMALKYRESGTVEWTVVDAIKLTENTVIDAEDYFKLSISELKPGTAYDYSVGLKDSSNDSDWSDIFIFTTAREDIEEFTFIAISDNQGRSWGGSTSQDKGYKYTYAAVNEAFEEHPDAAFMINIGDITEQAFQLNQWNWYFKCLQGYATSVPHFAAIGNHDTVARNSNNYFSLHFNHPDNGSNALDPEIAGQVTDEQSQVLVANPEETIYSFNYDNTHFVVLNSGACIGFPPEDDKLILNAQRAWLIADLEANRDAKWTIVIVHEANYHRYGGAYNLNVLADVIESYGVDLVLQGHNHLYTRTYPMKNGAIATKTAGDLIPQGVGTIYSTIGATTLLHDQIGDPNVEQCTAIVNSVGTQPTYTAITVKDNKIAVTTKQVNGLVIDEFIITDGTPDKVDTPFDTPTVNDDATQVSSDNDLTAIIIIAASILAAGAITTVSVLCYKRKRSKSGDFSSDTAS